MCSSDLDLSVHTDDDSSEEGSFNIATSQTLDTLGNNFTLSGHDIALEGNLDAGLGSVYIGTKTFETLYLGDTGDSMSLSSEELGRIDAQDIYFGSSSTGDIEVANVASADLDQINGNITIQALRDDNKVSFITGASTFNNLNVLADDGVVFSTDVSTSTGDFIVDADVDNASDTSDKIGRAHV